MGMSHAELSRVEIGIGDARGMGGEEGREGRETGNGGVLARCNVVAQK